MQPKMVFCGLYMYYMSSSMRRERQRERGREREREREREEASEREGAVGVPRKRGIPGRASYVEPGVGGVGGGVREREREREREPRGLHHPQAHDRKQRVEKREKRDGLEAGGTTLPA